MYLSQPVASTGRGTHHLWIIRGRQKSKCHSDWVKYDPNGYSVPWPCKHERLGVHIQTRRANQPIKEGLWLCNCYWCFSWPIKNMQTLGGLVEIALLPWILWLIQLKKKFKMHLSGVISLLVILNTQIFRICRDRQGKIGNQLQVALPKIFQKAQPFIFPQIINNINPYMPTKL